MIMQDIIKAIQIVSSLHCFWTSMAASTMMAMFFGVAIYDGEVPHARRGIISVASYLFMVFLTMGSYVVHRYPTVRPDVAYQLFIYPVQIVFLSLFWLAGFVGAIAMFRYFKKKYDTV